MRKKLLILFCVFSVFGAYLVYNSIKQEEPRYKKGMVLDAVFPVDSIKSISVSNFYGTHELTPTELGKLVAQLRNATYAGRIILKPSHIRMQIQMKDSSPAKIAYIYGTKGCIIFVSGTDKYKHPLFGNFYLPNAFNFDNYR